MLPDAASIRQYLSRRTPNYADASIQSLLEFIYRFYTELNPIDNDTLRSGFHSLGPVFEALPVDQADLLFDALVSMTSETEHQAFLDGMTLGFRLAFELAQS